MTLLKSIGLTCLLALIISAFITGLDWYANPSELFQNENGTDWSIVSTTFFSWFLPLSLLAVLVSLVVVGLIKYFSEPRSH